MVNLSKLADEDIYKAFFDPLSEILVADFHLENLKRRYVLPEGHMFSVDLVAEVSTKFYNPYLKYYSIKLHRVVDSSDNRLYFSKYDLAESIWEEAGSLLSDEYIAYNVRRSLDIETQRYLLSPERISCLTNIDLRE